MANPNLQLLTDAAKLLEPILGELVFVGGCATALLITDKGAADVRPTFDVDAIAEITSYAAYDKFSERLRKLGFQEDTRQGAPLCRWQQKTTTLDVMPLEATDALAGHVPPDDASQERVGTIISRLEEIASL
jgi:hypothetical protein